MSVQYIKCNFLAYIVISNFPRRLIAGNSEILPEARQIVIGSEEVLE